MSFTTKVTLLNDPRVRAVPVMDNREPLVEWRHRIPLAAQDTLPAPLVREGLAVRLHRAQATLPPGVHLKVVEGFRPASAQREIIAMYEKSLMAEHPGIDQQSLTMLSSRFVSPLDVAPHVAGAAVDLTLVDDAGREYAMGTAIDATPEDSRNACYFDAPVSAESRASRRILARALSRVGLVNYPTEWWHWSFGDRYWALMTGASHAFYGPLDGEIGADPAHASRDDASRAHAALPAAHAATLPCSMPSLGDAR